MNLTHARGSLHVARQGIPRWFQADAASITRLAYCKQFAKNHLQASASNSTIIRRALQMYANHLEKLLTTKPKSDARNMESWNLLAANKGDSADVPDEAILAAPNEKLSVLFKAHRHVNPLIQTLLAAAKTVGVP